MFPSILFLTAGGRHPEYNFGHLSRCVMTAARIRRVSPEAACHFLIPRDSAGIDFLVHSGFTPRVLKAKEFTYSEIRKISDRVSADILVLDRLDWPVSFVRALRRLDKVIIVLDAGTSAAALADVSLNPLISNASADFKGFRYLLLSSHHKAAKVPSAARRIVISFGGNEPIGLTLKVLNTLRLFPGARSFNLQIFRPGTGVEKALSPADLKGFSASSRIHDFGSGFFKQLNLADTLLTGGGLTMFEGVKRGIVTGVIELRTHQRPNIKSLTESGSLVPLGDLKQLKSHFFLTRLKQLLLDKKKRSTLHEKSIQYWDSLEYSGKVENILQVMTRDPGKNSASLWVKRLTPAVRLYIKKYCSRNKIQTVRYRLPYKSDHV